MIDIVDRNYVLDYTRDLWDALRCQHIFITGGTGFFGCWLLESLIWANDRLGLDANATILTRHPEAFRKKVSHLADHPTVQLLQGDVRSFEFPAGKFSHIIHAATEASVRLNTENPLLMLETIVMGTRHVLEFAAFCGAEKFLLTSSGAVYGKQPSEMTHITENYCGAPDPLDPGAAYGEGKRLAEHLCTLYARQSDMEMKIARCYAFVGPYLPLNAHFAVGNFIRDGLNGGPIVVEGDGTPQRSYMYAADLAIWLWTILFRGTSLRPYNVGSQVSLSIVEAAQRVAEQFSASIAVEIRGEPNKQMPVERYVPDTSRAEDEFGLKERIHFYDALSRTIQWNSHG